MALHVERPFCVGLDVHRNNVWAAVIIHYKDTDKPRTKTRKFGSSCSEFVKMASWIRSFFQDEEDVSRWMEGACADDIHVYMESTGKYSTPVYNFFEENGFFPHLVNPRNVRTIAGQKTDQKDCLWIAELASGGYLQDSCVPVRTIRDARNLSRRRTKLAQDRADEIRRQQNILTEANIRIDLIFSDITGDSAQKVINYLLENEEPVLEDVERLIHKSCKIMRFKSNAERKEKEDLLLSAFQGAKFTETQKYLLKSIQTRIDDLSIQISDLESMMEQTLMPFKREMEIIQTLPGVGKLASMQILAEIGPDMSCFASSKTFVSWCGLCPSSKQSNGKHKSVKIGNGGQYLKPTLIQCALNAVRNPNSYFGKIYQKLKARRGAKRALIAIARKMMVSAWHMLTKGEVFNPQSSGKKMPSDKKKVQNKLIEALLDPQDQIEQDVVQLAKIVLEKAGSSREALENVYKSIGNTQNLTP